MRIYSLEELAKWKEEVAKWRAEKAALFSVSRIPRDDRPAGKWILYVREPKAGVLYVGRLRISWRRPATIPDYGPLSLASLWSAAWDPGWRSGWAAGHRTACQMLGGPTLEPEIPAAPKKEPAA